MTPWLKQGQELKRRASNSQDHAEITLGDGKAPIILATLSDMHVGSIGAEYELFTQFTNEINNTPNLYVSLIGDYTEWATGLRSVAETCAQIIDPGMQRLFIESWIEEIKHKVAWATHDNHQSSRSEKSIGYDLWNDVFGSRVIYHANIGHVDVRVGSQLYKIASSHKFRGGSMLNPAHACMRYLRMEGQDREIAMQGDTHVPMAAKYREGQCTRVVINTGNLNLKSGYARRYFSLSEHPFFPCLVLWPDRHEVTPLWSVAEALRLLAWEGATKTSRK
jgi:hypothetical protein